MPYRNYDPDRWRDYDRDRSSDFDRGARGYEGRGGEMERPRMGGRGSAQDREWDRFDRDWDREAARGYGGEPWYGGAT